MCHLPQTVNAKLSNGEYDFNPSFEYIKPYLQDADITLLEPFADFDACMYFAANGDPAVSYHDPVKDLMLNTVMLVKLLTAVKFDRFVYFSSGAVYDTLPGEVNPGEQHTWPPSRAHLVPTVFSAARATNQRRRLRSRN